jgi:hypothetical protein
MQGMLLQTIIAGNVQSATPSVDGQVADLIIVAEQIASPAIRTMLHPIIIQGNVRPVIILLLGGQMPHSAMRDLQIVFLVMLRILRPTITLGNVLSATIQIEVGTIPISAIMD